MSGRLISGGRIAQDWTTDYEASPRRFRQICSFVRVIPSAPTANYLLPAAYDRRGG